MPPIINSADLGAVEVGDSQLFVEFTGTSIEVLNVAIAIMAADMADRGFQIERITTKYPYDTPWGRDVAFPHDPGSRLDVPVASVHKGIGLELPEDEVVELLERFGLDVERKGEGVLGVQAPFYRNDLLHVMDVVEDVAICRGYDSFPHHPPTSYTVGRLTPVERASQQMRQRLVGLGFQELATPVLTHRDNLTEKMGCGGDELVEILNPMTENFGVIRNRLLPTLLECEQRSYRASYPHRVFECGEAARLAPGTVMGTETVRQAAALIAHAEAGFAEAHSVLDSLLNGLGHAYRLDACEVAGYLDGRCGVVMVGDLEVGTIGEIHPEVLDRWGIKVPCAAFELDVTALTALRES
jgi:phenylalanyl-tRNA synthetase beta chain